MRWRWVGGAGLASVRMDGGRLCGGVDMSLKSHMVRHSLRSATRPGPSGPGRQIDDAGGEAVIQKAGRTDGEDAFDGRNVGRIAE